MTGNVFPAMHAEYTGRAGEVTKDGALRSEHEGANDTWPSCVALTMRYPALGKTEISSLQLGNDAANHCPKIKKRAMATNRATKEIRGRNEATTLRETPSIARTIHQTSCASMGLLNADRATANGAT